MKLRIATRGSTLALRQTRTVIEALAARHPGLVCETLTVTTSGDANQQAPIAAIGDGVFVRGVERELLAGRADAAVHSAKDMPSDELPGLVIAAFPERGAVEDVLVSRDGHTLAELPPGARLGTGSPRRAALARSLRPDVRVELVRGNVDTRLAKLDAGEYDALVLAAAGLERLERAGRITERLDPVRWPPAPGQGALAVQCRADAEAVALLAPIDDTETRAAVTAERALLRRLGSGCRIPVAALGTVEAGLLRMRGALLTPDGGQRVDAEVHGRPEEAEALGTALAEALLRTAPFAVV